MGSVVNLLTASLVATVATMVTGKANVARLLLLGGYAGVLNDLAVEKILPMVPGMSDYATLPPGVGSYASLPQFESLGEYATEQSVEGAMSGVSMGEF
jgi:hypothetical protein